MPRTEEFDLDTLSDEEIEATARRQGWTSEEEWDEERAEREGRRKPKQFLSARDWLERAQESAPILRERNRKLDTEVSDLRAQLEGVSQTQKEMADLLRSQTEMAKKANKAAYERGKKEAEERMRQAKVDGDFDEYEAARAEKARLEAEAGAIDTPPKEEKKPDADIDEDTKSWLRQNKWFSDEIHLNGYMIKMHKKVKAEQPGLSVTEALEEAKRLVIERFPEEFGKNPNRSGKTVLSPNNGGGLPPSDAKKRFAALPPEVKAQYERQREMFKKQHGVDFTVDEYMEAYGQ